jgi:hypothetical protein
MHLQQSLVRCAFAVFEHCVFKTDLAEAVHCSAGSLLEGVQDSVSKQGHGPQAVLFCSHLCD